MNSYISIKIKPYLPASEHFGLRHAGILFLLMFCTFYAKAQKLKSGTLIFEGVVYGYHHDPTKKLLKKSKQFVIEGLLSRVNIDVYHEDNLVYTEKTNKNGEFTIPLPLDGVFKLELSKHGYETNILTIDTRNISTEKSSNGIAFTGAEFMLNSYKNKEYTLPEYMGILYYDPESDYFDFFANEKEAKRQNNSIALIRKAVIKNKNSSLLTMLDSSIVSVRLLHKRKDTSAITVKGKKHLTGFGLAPAGIKNITTDNISLRKNEIEKAREQLEDDKLYAVSMDDSIIINAREAIIRASEVELQNALTLIATQKSEIHYKKRELYIMLGLFLLLAGFSAVLYFHYREKKRTNNLLETQNRKILDSITYAKRIQQSILIDEEEISPRFESWADFFIYNRPKDIVSGDFYWLSNIDDKLVVAVVDCTGHGVPGAFMSLIANTLLNEIVNEKRRIDPAVILKHLHKGITDALHQEKDNNRSYDGMDVALCVIDKKKNKIKYAGAINPLYVVQDGAVNVLQADMHSIGGRSPKFNSIHTHEFTNHTITLKKETSLYMFSDGCVDQFGGHYKNTSVEGRTRKKFGTERFKQLLLDIQAHDMSRQKEIIQTTMNEWRGSYKQIDDMLVVGMKIRISS